ncbi:MAG: ATP-dependent DNA ligase [Nanoarchaeota archaeon]
MKYADLVAVYEEIEGTSKRLEKTAIIAAFLKKTSVSDLDKVVLLLQGKVAPLWDEAKLGVAARIVIKAIALTIGTTPVKVESEWKHTGDLGLAVEKLMEKRTQATLFSQELSVQKVFENLKKLSTLEGQGTVDQKVKLMSELLTSAKAKEAKYIIRTVLEDLRVGIAQGTLRDAIVWAFLYEVNLSEKNIIEDRKDYKEVVDAVQDAYSSSNDFTVVARAAKEGLPAIQRIGLDLGRPVQVMLAQKEITIANAFKRVGKPAALEYKYDGFRMVIHKGGGGHKGSDGKERPDGKGNIRIYTRRLENVTAQFPEVVNYVRENVKGESFILDGEAVGFDAKSHRYLPFQSISQRIRRKYGILEVAKKFPVELNVFDLLLYNGKTLIKAAFRKRREILEKVITEKPKKIVLSRQIITDDENKAKAFFTDAIAKGNEGIMFKNLDAPYKPGSRVGYMVKFKSAMETLDLVVVGAEWGEGKRKGWLTSFTLACKDGDEWKEIGKVGTGIKELEEQGLSFKELTETLKPLILVEKGREVKIRPKVILEIKFEEIQKSPSYGSGYALRFPRVIRERTMEKGLDDVSDIDLVRKLFEEQKKV